MPESKRLELMVEKLLALLISASRETDRRARTETNHLRFEESFRTERLSQLIGGEKGLISVGCFSEHVRVCALGFPRRLIDTIS